LFAGVEEEGEDGSDWECGVGGKWRKVGKANEEARKEKRKRGKVVKKKRDGV